jgi:hypothetical protein
VVSGTTKSGKSVEITFAGADLDAHAGHRARKGTLAKSKLQVSGLRRA